MKISYLRLKNFGIVKSFERHFDAGMILFSGDNGQGKTTCVDAMDLNLFDKTKKTLEDWLNWEDPSGFEVEIHFDQKGVGYKSFVGYNGKTTRWLEVEGNPTPFTGAREVVSYLAAILDPKMDRPAMFSFQDTPEIIKVTPAERREQIRKVFDVNFNQEVALLKGQEEALSKTIDDLKISLTAKQSQTFVRKPVPELPISEAEFSSKEAERHAVSSSIQRVSLEIEGIEKSKKALAEAESNAVRAKSLFDAAQADLEKLLAVAPPPALEEDADYKALVDQTKIEEQVRSLESSIATKKSEESAIVLRRPVVFDNASYQKAITEKVLSSSRLAQAKQDLSNVESGTCPTCGSPYSSGTINSYREKVKAAEEACTKAQAEATEAESKKTVYDEEAKAQADQREKKSQLASEVVSLEAQVTRLKDQRTHALAQIESKKSAYSTAKESRAEKIRLQTQIVDDRKVRKQETASSLEALKLIPIPSQEGLLSEIEILRQSLLALDTVLSSFREAKANRTAAIRDNEELEKAEEARKKEVEELTGRIQKETAELTYLEEARSAFQKDFPMFIVMFLLKEIEYHANAFLQDTYKGRYFLTFVEKSDALHILYGPKQKDVRANAGGYEQQIFSLAYKIGIARSQGLDFMVLDEPDSAASEDNSVLFYTVLGEAKQHFGQIFTVTHRKRAKGFLTLEHGAEVIEFVGGVAN